MTKMIYTPMTEKFFCLWSGAAALDDASIRTLIADGYFPGMTAGNPDDEARIIDMAIEAGLGDI